MKGIFLSKNLIKDYFQLIKPGIVFGNAITVVAGFSLASKGVINGALLLATLAGLSLVVASGCVFNNYIDRDIDAEMERTKGRALAQGRISLRNALVYGVLLWLIGFYILLCSTNFLTVEVALVGLFVYVGVYSLWLKRSSVYGTLIGSISGAVPPVVGYLAVSNNIDAGAIILFIILTLWQMPHSFAIAIYRLEDYVKAGIPVLPAKRGVAVTKLHMFFYTIFFTPATLMLSILGYTGRLYFVAMSLLGIAWLALCVRGFFTNDNKIWARNMFIFSIVIIVVFAVVVSFEKFI